MYVRGCASTTQCGTTTLRVQGAEGVLRSAHEVCAVLLDAHFSTVLRNTPFSIRTFSVFHPIHQNNQLVIRW